MKNVVYLVRQTQWNVDDSFEDIYKNTTIYVCSTRKEAVDRTRKLNKQYASGVKLTPFGDFKYVKDEAEYIHYYDIKAMKVDENFIG